MERDLSAKDFQSVGPLTREGNLSSEDLRQLRNLNVPIPRNESKRLRILRETGMLNTSHSGDIDLDRLAALAARIFDAPIAMVTLVDAGKVIMKSVIGDIDEKWSQIPRDLSFDAFVVLNNSPDVLVCSDAKTDVRFKNNPLVVDSPSIRFYAGTPLIVEGVKVGALSIYDTVPRARGFDIRKNMNLLDLGEAVAGIIRFRRAANVKLSEERASLMLELTHNLRTPLTTLELAMQEARKILSTNETSMSRPSYRDIWQSLQEAHAANMQLKLMVDSNIKLGTIINEAREGTLPEHCYCQITEVVSSVQEMLGRLEATARVVWEVDEQNHFHGYQATYPELLRVCLLSMLSQLVVRHVELKVSIQFQEDAGSNPEEGGQSFSKVGTILIQVYMNSVATSPELDEFAPVNSALKLVDGGLIYYRGERKPNQAVPDLEFWLPCKMNYNINTSTRKRPSITNGKSAKIITTPTTKDMSISSATPTNNTVPPSSGPSTSATTTSQSDSPTHSANRSGGTQVSPNTSTNSPRLKVIHVLVIEDSLPVQKMISRWLQRQGCIVETAVNGKIGLDILREKTFDMVLCDFLMPVQDGVTTMRLFREWQERGSLSRTPTSSSGIHNSSSSHSISSNTSNNLTNFPMIVGMSATASPVEYREAFENGMHFFIPKPIETNLLSIILQQLSINSDIETSCVQVDMELFDCDIRPSFENCRSFLRESGLDAMISSFQKRMRLSPTKLKEDADSGSGKPLDTSDNANGSNTANVGNNSNVPHSKQFINPGHSSMNALPNNSTNDDITMQSTSSSSLLASPTNNKLTSSSEKVTRVSSTASVSSSGSTSSISGPLRALVIEDSIAVQKLLARHLVSFGCEVSTALNGVIGLNMLKENHYHLVFCDFLMPVQDGILTMKLHQEWLETCGRIHGSRPYPIMIGMSATASIKEQMNGFNAGMHFFCPKPVDADLIELIVGAMSNSKTVEHACVNIDKLVIDNNNSKWNNFRSFMHLMEYE